MFSQLIPLVWLAVVVMLPLTVVMTVFGYARQMKSDRSHAEQLSAANLQAINGLTMANLMRMNQFSHQQSFAQAGQSAANEAPSAPNVGGWETVANMNTNPDFYGATPALANSAAASLRKKDVGHALTIGFLVGAVVLLVLVLVFS
jgi:hypothetical protein